jgi:hypothetical protein
MFRGHYWYGNSPYYQTGNDTMTRDKLTGMVILITGTVIVLVQEE